jgi:hypothetical protein
MVDMQVPMEIVQAVKSASLPVVYERAKQALMECEKIDECLEWADKAAALASYARQAEDVELENLSKRIRARAYRRVGEMLKEIPSGKPGPKSVGGLPQISRSQAAADAGLSRDQKVTAIRIASIPDEDFEDEIESPNPPGTVLLSRIASASKPVAEPAVLTNEHLHEVYRQDIARRVLEGLLGIGTNSERCDVGLLAAQLLAADNTKRLALARQAIELMLRLKAELDRAGRSALRVVE